MWAIRCHLENNEHRQSVFTTLTYDDERKPPTLEKHQPPRFVRSLRKRLGPTRTIRYFASGEYGERTQRPHYHALLFGVGMGDKKAIEDAWGLGYADVQPITPQRIAYTAGYTAKKINWKQEVQDFDYEEIDQETGEVTVKTITWQPPFTLMSRRPGIGGAARRWLNSWRLYAINPTNGHRLPVPRFLHDAWRAVATDEEIEELLDEKQRFKMNNTGKPTGFPDPSHSALGERNDSTCKKLMRKAAIQKVLDYQQHSREVNAKKQQEMKAAKRKY